MLRLKINKLKHLFLFFAFWLINNCGLACVCDSIKPLSDSIFRNAKTIFIGRVISIQKNSDEIRLDFIVKTDYKNALKNDTITIYTNSELGMCGMDVQTGEIWYIFIEHTIQENFWGYECDRSVRISKKKYSRKRYGNEVNYYNKLNRTNKRYFKKEQRKLKSIIRHQAS